MPQEQPKYQLDYLSNYIALTMLLTGEKPTIIALTPDFYTWYVQETQRMADVLGLTPGFREGPKFNGIPVEKKTEKLNLSL
jgi:hypothetical protein